MYLQCLSRLICAATSQVLCWKVQQAPGHKYHRVSTDDHEHNFQADGVLDPPDSLFDEIDGNTPSHKMPLPVINDDRVAKTGGQEDIECQVVGQ